MQADQLEDVLAPKNSMSRAGLPVFTFPQIMLQSATVCDQTWSLSSRPGITNVEPGPGSFRAPFNVIAGGQADLADLPFWFVRHYRYAQLSTWTLFNVAVPFVAVIRNRALLRVCS